MDTVVFCDSLSTRVTDPSTHQTAPATELVQRLKARQTESPEKLALRLATAREELEQVELFDYYVINAEGHLDQTVDTIEAIIQTEHHRTLPRQVRL